MSDDPETESRGPRRRRGLADLFTDGAVLRAIGVAIVVGTVLNLINQGEALIGHGKVEWAKLALTYSVPFFVSLHGALHAGAPYAKVGTGFAQKRRDKTKT